MIQLNHMKDALYLLAKLISDNRDHAPLVAVIDAQLKKYARRHIEGSAENHRANEMMIQRLYNTHVKPYFEIEIDSRHYTVRLLPKKICAATYPTAYNKFTPRERKLADEQ